jgi:hypothetical protein
MNEMSRFCAKFYKMNVLINQRLAQSNLLLGKNLKHVERERESERNDFSVVVLNFDKVAAPKKLFSSRCLNQ